jgi:hypothetical protein
MKYNKFLKKLGELYRKEEFPVKWYLQANTFSFEIHHHDALLFLGDKPLFESDIYHWNYEDTAEKILTDIKLKRCYFKKCHFLRCMSSMMVKEIPTRAIVVLKGFEEGARISIEYNGKIYIDNVAIYDPFPYHPEKEKAVDFFERMRRYYPVLRKEPLGEKKEQETPIFQIIKSDTHE